MHIVGIVAEYNPFHNGHAYQIQQARAITGCDSVIVAMSGDFVQRGAPAIIDKKLRTTIALANGVDMVLQIPVSYSTSSAEGFAYGSVALLITAGIDTLAFGCESNDIGLLQQLANLFFHEPLSYKESLQFFLKEGDSFPLARCKATLHYMKEHSSYDGIADYSLTELEQVLQQPNNILAIEYLKALKRLKAQGFLSKEISICPIPRIGTGYHSTETINGICSATALRQMLISDIPWTEFVPSQSVSLLETYISQYRLLSENSFSPQLGYSLLKKRNSGFSCFLGGTPALSNRIINHLANYQDHSSFCKLLQTKECTYSAISRLLTHILLDITKERLCITTDSPIPYIRVLGFKRNAASLLSYIAELDNAPLLTNVKNMAELSNPKVLEFLELDLFARMLYQMEAGALPDSDYQFPVIV